MEKKQEESKQTQQEEQKKAEEWKAALKAPAKDNRHKTTVYEEKNINRM